MRGLLVQTALSPPLRPETGHTPPPGWAPVGSPLPPVSLALHLLVEKPVAAAVGLLAPEKRAEQR